MLLKTIVPFEQTPNPVDDARTSTTLINSFLSSLQNRSLGLMGSYKAIAMHFLFWIKQQGIELSSISCSTVKEFMTHDCRCSGFSRHRLKNPLCTSRVRRFVRFIEDQGLVSGVKPIESMTKVLSEYQQYIISDGFGPTSTRIYKSEAEHFLVWLRTSRLPWSKIGVDTAEYYADHNCQCPIGRKRGKLVGHAGPARRRRGAQRFIAFLRTQDGLLEASSPKTMDRRLQVYRDWLGEICGSSEATIKRYCSEIRQCLPLFGINTNIDAALLRRVLKRRIDRTPKSASLTVTILRSYIRFLIFCNECRPELLHAFLPVRRYTLATLPKYLDDDTIEGIIVSCGTRSAVEIRDKAVILLLARLGLRAGDICNLQLSDLDWQRGHILVGGKERRRSRMPMPQDVGDAIIDYLERARPHVREERVFLRTLAPFTPFRTSSEITGIVSRVYKRGGIKDLPSNSHIFRHSLATRMLRAGAGLESVGTVLRHRFPSTTAIYAKVDINMLMKIAQPWPGEAPC